MAGYFPDLLDEYKQLLKQMRADGVTSGDLYREVKQAIEWMETGYDPAEVRAATRVDAYVIDHHLMQDIIKYCDSERLTPDYLVEHLEDIPEMDWNKEVNYMAKIKQEVNNAMVGLTPNERAAYILVKAELYSYAKAARVLGIEKGTLQSYIQRAEYKIQKNIKYGAQMDLFNDIA